ncbi:hypothetical protein NXW20_00275 [Bacteroides faecis]|nr:hypothetical protein [Bacteroides faecis]MCS2194178.1 hypothetical protein [Bacteroides faecis]
MPWILPAYYRTYYFEFVRFVYAVFASQLGRKYHYPKHFVRFATD